jgi:hypothetical protein
MRTWRALGAIFRVGTASLLAPCAGRYFEARPAPGRPSLD